MPPVARIPHLSWNLDMIKCFWAEIHVAKCGLQQRKRVMEEDLDNFKQTTELLAKLYVEAA